MSSLSACTTLGQKRALDPTIDGCVPPYGFWELNAGPLEGQSMFLSAAPSLQPPDCMLLMPLV